MSHDFSLQLLADPVATPEALDDPDATVCQSDAWLDFLAETQSGTPVRAAVMRSGEQVGRFTGMVVRRMGVRILGSPLRGWTTLYMGFSLQPGISRADVLPALERFAFEDLRCHHLEIMDRRLTGGDYAAAGLRHEVLRGFEIDLSRPDEEIFEGMSSACRRCIRKAERLGVTIEEAEDDGFAEDYYAQLRDVFAKQRLAPTYPLSRVEALIRHLRPTGRLLTLRARDADGASIATGIFPAANDLMYFWGGASWRSGQHNRPNEALQWYAMRYWKARGITRYDMGGYGEYKRKYGGREIAVPWGRRERIAVLRPLRSVVRTSVAVRTRARGALARGAPALGALAPSADALGALACI